MRTKDDPQIFVNPKCAVSPRCDKGWEVWCRGCCLTFCKVHADRAIHACPSRDKRSQATRFEVLPFSKGGPALERGDVLEAQPSNGVNGTVHRNGSNGKKKK